MLANLPPEMRKALAPFAPSTKELTALEADQHYNELKNSGELERRRHAEALRLQIENHGVRL